MTWNGVLIFLFLAVTFQQSVGKPAGDGLADEGSRFGSTINDEETMDPSDSGAIAAIVIFIVVLIALGCCAFCCKWIVIGSICFCCAKLCCCQDNAAPTTSIVIHSPNGQHQQQHHPAYDTNGGWSHPMSPPPKY